ncbi:MAG: TetR/AcrR family transcriptional regulator [Nocardioides sp.]
MTASNAPAEAPATPAASGSRMRGEERRTLVLDAATRCFGRTGFAGTSTDAVAREAGVSQPYVVRIFGTKQALFLEVFARAGARIRDAFAAVIEDGAFDPNDEADQARLGAAYTDLLEDRELMLVLLHGFAAGDNDEIGERARASMDEIVALLRAGGMTAEQVRDFVAQGMLLTVLMAMRAPEHMAENVNLQQLVTCAFGEATSLVC